MSAAAVAVGCHYAAQLSIPLSGVLGGTTFGMLYFMAKVHDPSFQERIEESLGQRGPSHRDDED